MWVIILQIPVLFVYFNSKYLSIVERILFGAMLTAIPIVMSFVATFILGNVNPSVLYMLWLLIQVIVAIGCSFWLRKRKKHKPRYDDIIDHD